MSIVHNSKKGELECDFLTLEDILIKLGHSFVDYVKIDIEGEEYSLFKDWISRKYCPPVGQIWVEFHPERTGNALEEMLLIALRMRKLGMIPFYDKRYGFLFINVNQYINKMKHKMYSLKSIKNILYSADKDWVFEIINYLS